MEAGWLTAVAVVPVFVAVDAARPFEPAKAVILQVVAVVMAGAWLVARIAGGSGGPRRVPRWLFAPVLVLAATAAVSTVLSLAPGVSLAGSAARSQGALTMAAVWTVAVLAATSLQRAEQVDRLFTVIVVAAAPVSLVLLFAHVGGDAVPVAGEGGRPGGTFGNPLLAGGWLVVAAPFVVARAVTAFRRRAAGPLAAAAHVTVGVMVVAALLVTSSRGPLLGLTAGASVAVLVAAARHGRRMLVAVAGAVALLGVAAVVLASSGRPVVPVDVAVPDGRPPAVVDVDRGTVAVRDRLWRAATSALADGGEDLRTAASGDPHHRWRPAIGYGPDATEAVLSRYADGDLWRYETADSLPDRAHNVILDSLLTLGVLGAAAHLAAIGGAVVVALSRLGLVTARRASAGTVVLLVAGGAAGAVGASVVRDPSWAAPAAGVGAVAALAGVLGVIAFAPYRRAARPTHSDAVEPGACLCAVVGYWVTAQTSVDSIGALVLVWGAIAVLASRPGPGRSADTRTPGEEFQRPVSSPGGPAILEPGPAPPPGAARDGLAVIAGLVVGAAVHAVSAGETGPAIGSVVVAGLLAVLVVEEPARLGSRPPEVDAARPSGRTMARRAAVIGATAAAVVAPVSVLADRAGPSARLPLELAAAAWIAAVVGVVLTAGMVLAWAARTPAVANVAARQPPALVIAPGMAVMLLAAAAVLIVGVRPAAADLLRGRAGELVGPVDAVEWFERAAQLDGDNHGQLALGSAALDAATAAPVADRSRLLGVAEQALAAAQEGDPFSSEEAGALADLHAVAADLVAERSDALRHRRAAARHAAQAAALRPGAAIPHALHALAVVELARHEHPNRGPFLPPGGDDALHRADELDPDLALTSAVRARASAAWAVAVNHALDALSRVGSRFDGRSRHDRLAVSLAHRALRSAQDAASAMGQEGALLEMVRAATAAPDIDTHLAAAGAARRAGRTAEAVELLQRATTLVPADDRLAGAAVRAALLQLQRDDTG